MRSILEQLQDDQSVLLMYLADELPAGDRQIVETRLATDGALRAALDELREAQDSVAQALGDLDRAQPASAQGQGSLRQVSRQIRQWQTDRAREAAASGPTHRGRLSWWLYPGAAAIAAIIIYTVWWGFQPAEPGSLRNAPGPQISNQPYVFDESRFRGPSYNPSDNDSLLDAEQELDQVKMLRTIIEVDEQDTVI